jgi:ATP-dependent RNA circularization protein (DNA/RNA ligase family)
VEKKLYFPFEKIRETFSEMNKKELKEFEDKLKDIHKTIAEGLNQGIKDFSEGFAEAVVLGKSLGDTLKNIGTKFIS